MKIPWQTVWTALAALGTIAVAILAIWGDWLKAKIVGPRLSLVPHNFKGSVTRVDFSDQSGQVVGSSSAIYYHLRVENKRPLVSVKNCRVILTALHRRGPDGQFHSVALVVPLQFVWSPREWAPIFQTFSDKAVLDFGSIVENNNRFIPALYVMSNNFQGIIEANEAVRYTLDIYADNYKSLGTQVFEVAWNGEFSDNLDNMQRHLTIREIKK